MELPRKASDRPLDPIVYTDSDVEYLQQVLVTETTQWSNRYKKDPIFKSRIDTFVSARNDIIGTFLFLCSNEELHKFIYCFGLY